MSERCLEVVGHYNHTLQLLDVHNTRMSTPAVYKVRPIMPTILNNFTDISRLNSWLKVCRRKEYCVPSAVSPSHFVVMSVASHMTSRPLVTCWRWKTGSPQATTLSCFTNRASGSHPQLPLKGKRAFELLFSWKVSSLSQTYDSEILRDFNLLV